ncbi:hypothetical protein B0A68_10330 [Flavobacterium reichenbachii]|nr:hypothetical protein B0A68_10330 [Flavobacterium reichenbachii]
MEKKYIPDQKAVNITLTKTEIKLIFKNNIIFEYFKKSCFDQLFFYVLQRPKSLIALNIQVTLHF